MGHRAILTFDTNAYFDGHRREPRGHGRWGFCPAREWHRGNYLDHVQWAPPSTYTEAKRWLKESGAHGHWVVCP